MCVHCDKIGEGNEPFSIYNDEDLDGCTTLQIVRSHQWKDHGYLREGRGHDIDIDSGYSTRIKYCPFCGAWLGGEYEKC